MNKMALRERLIKISRVGLERVKIGPQSEEVVREACRQLKLEGKILEFEKKDRPGSDFSIHLLDGKIFQIEVKSSLSGKFSHQMKYPTIPVLVVPLEKPLSRLSKKRKRKLIDRIKRNILERRKIG